MKTGHPGALIALMIGGEDGLCVACGREGRIELPLLWPTRVGPLLMLVLAELPLVGAYVYGHWPRRWRQLYGICACCLPAIAVRRHEWITRHSVRCWMGAAGSD